jgi:hypothetical protein
MEISHHAKSFNSLLEILHILPFIYVKGEVTSELLFFHLKFILCIHAFI